MSNKAIVKTIGKFNDRALFNFSFLPLKVDYELDSGITIGFGPSYGLSLSLFNPNFLIEFNILPLIEKASEFYE